MKKRIRKKKHVGEFRESGFELVFQFEPMLTAEQGNQLLDDFLENAIEANDLYFGGGGRDGRWSGVAYASGPPGTTTSAKQRSSVLAWLEPHPQVIAVQASDFFDLWHDELPSEHRKESS